MNMMSRLGFAALLMGGLAGSIEAAPAVAMAQGANNAQVTIRADQNGGVVSRHIFGQFAEHLGFGIYGGIWVGPDSPIPNTRGYRNDVVAALKALHVPVVRWPGGCFADEYNWREGIGPREKRPVKINTHWGGVTEDNAFGTHEFMDFAELIGTDAYISGNVGSTSPREMAEWVEYITSPAGSTLAKERAANGRTEPWKLPMFGIGNELWGCGGQMLPEYAGNVTRRYSTFIKVPEGQKIVKIASGAGGENYEWTDALMKIAGKQIDGLALHHYAVPNTWEKKGSATHFTQEEWASTIGASYMMDELVTKHSAVMDKYDPEKRVWLAVDEWGNWFDVEPGTNPGFLYQQNTLRDAVTAALNINIFSRHNDRVKLTNIAQMVNVLQAMILTKDDKMVLTPTYHVYEMYKPFQDATYLPMDVVSSRYRSGKADVPAVDAAAVRAKDGHIYIALVNLDPARPATVSAKLDGAKFTKASGRILTSSDMAAHNDFDRPSVIAPAAFRGASVKGASVSIALPSKSVVILRLE